MDEKTLSGIDYKHGDIVDLGKYRVNIIYKNDTVEYLTPAILSTVEYKNKYIIPSVRYPQYVDSFLFAKTPIEYFYDAVFDEFGNAKKIFDIMLYRSHGDGWLEQDTITTVKNIDEVHHNSLVVLNNVIYRFVIWDK
jgi:hypothetical protein